MKKLLIQASSIVLMGAGFMSMGNAYGVNAPVEPEMLTSLRASQTINAARDPGRGIIKMEGDQLVSVEFDDNNANWGSAQTALEKAFNIVISLEESPLWEPEVVPFGHHTFAYSVHVNERLVDALNRLTEASEGTVRWRLLRGKIILSAMPQEQREGVPLIGDRRVAVDIKAESLYEAFLQLEAQYNTQYQDFALVALAPYEQSVAFLTSPPEAGKSGMLELRCEGSLRDIVLELLSQTEKAETSYMLTVSRIYKTDEMPAPFYERGDLFHFALWYKTHSYYSGPKPEESEDDPLWCARQNEERRKRQRQYYIQNHPELAMESGGS
ncbi:MAG TPA: hypothetical protein PLQ42_11855 [Candidatus Hydrogenedentes bacterium]|jgi:hypothetical protein|nr:hypothetical protein [Candidatus Hydrogenedentota bacterium]HOM49431.1 hypothetical protein [Candidatus Hydrogenedentota bacterium]HOR51763.1 hypothetical protein [Candidatus Hydrogenedentota bacterium]HPK25773.1 hypothetical protein [Candidatus Hydrogenedentota bacterium]HPX87362.1 hypothetical protein [Candidatus Hydrogenedentota bacterium]